METTPKIKNAWKPIAIIAIIVAVILACSTIFFAAKSNQSKNNEVDESAEIETPVDTENYFVIEEWDIKFAIPEGLENPIYSIANHTDGDSILVTVDNFEQCQLGLLFRSIKSQIVVLGEIVMPNYTYNDYYYWYTSPQAVCTGDTGYATDADENELETVNLIQTMLTVPIR